MSKLRRPSIAAWAVNQLVRTQQRDVGGLLKAGDALQRAQADLLAKRGDRSKLREAVEAERAAVDRLLEKARGLLDSQGHELTAPRLEQVTETLHAAALDEDARAIVRDGCLERELRHVGIGSLGAAAPPAARRRPSAARKDGPAKQADPQPRAARQERAAQERAAREAEATARRRLERARSRESTAERRHERAAAELREAVEALAAARDVTGQAERDLQQAEQLLDGL